MASSKTLEQLREEANTAAEADMTVLGVHRGVEGGCGCDACVALLGQQYRWNFERLERASDPLYAMIAGGLAGQHGAWPPAANTGLFHPVPVEIVQPPPPHVHTPSQGSGLPHCTTCGQVLPPFERTVIIGSDG